MDGGTYAEALKVGFDEKQAGFLARMGVETKSEAVEAARDMTEDCLEQAEVQKEREHSAWWHGFAIGAIVGMAIIALIRVFVQ